MSRRDLIDQAAAVLADTDSVALACHVGPDGDALGSMMAFGLAARDAGKKVVTSFGSPFVVPYNLAFLPTVGLVPPDEFPESPPVMVVFDAGSADRLAELGHHAGTAGTLIVLDHHITNEGFGDIAVVDGDVAATGEIVAELLGVLDWPITPDIATCLHTAVVTDTGRFQYSATKPSTFKLAAGLVAAGADTDYIGQQVYEQAPFGYLRAAGAAMSRAELDSEAGVVSTTITHKDLADAGIDWGDIDNLINAIRLPVEADVAVLAKVHDDGRVKLSMRSRGGTDVGAIAASLGGGGHRFASGATVEAPPEEVIRSVIEKVRASK
jgi:phosphoesterase RecJ-like protein